MSPAKVKEEKDEEYKDEERDDEEMQTNGKDDEEEEDSHVHEERMNKLNYLLQRSQVYSRIMSDKMKREKEARQQKEKREAAAKDAPHQSQPKQAGRSTRSGQAGEKEDAEEGKPSKEQSSTAKKSKRRNEGQTYNVSDYLDNAAIEAGGDDRKAGGANATAGGGLSAKGTDLVTTSFKQPALITGATLRDYQLYGVEWLVGLYENGLNGILADEMGLGKTLQTISFLAYLKSKKAYGPFLVVCPASTLQNWMDEIERFAPEMKALLYYTPDKKQRKSWIDQYSREPHTQAEKQNFPIFVTSYEIAINDSRQLGSIGWKFIIVDEGHRLKNRNARLTRELKSYRSANRLILTGTPVHNNLSELWSLLNFILPDIFDNLEEFEGWFDFSDLQSEGGSARMLSRKQSQKVIATLRDILDPFILQREKKHVEKDLPPKKEYMLYAPLTVQQRDLYEEVLNNSIRARLTEMMTGMSWEDIKATGSLTAGEGWDEPLRHGEVTVDWSSTKGAKTKAAVKRGKMLGSSNGARTPVSGPSSGTSTPTKRTFTGLTKNEDKAEEQVEPIDGTSDDKPRKSRRSGRSSRTANYNEDNETEKQFMDRMETDPQSSSKRNGRRGTQTPQNRGDGDDHEIAVLSMDDVQRQSKEHAIKQAQKDIANMRLQNPVMQLRKLCGHPFLLYWPRDAQTGEYVANEDLINASGKMLMLNRLLDELWSRGHKVLLFSQFTTMLDILQDWCEDYKGVTPFRIDGTVDVHERSRLMKAFNTDTGPEACKLFLLSTRSGGLGVNLVAADTVIFYDTDWNPQMDRQAQDRAHRIGQTRPVLVFRLVTRDTAEERIVKRAFAKQQLSTLVMSGDQFSKQANDAAASFATKGRQTRVEEWTALLEDLKRETVQFEIADKDSEMISDQHLNMLLDRSPAAYERRQLGWKGEEEKKKANSRATFEVTDVLEHMENTHQDDGFDMDALSKAFGEDE